MKFTLSWLKDHLDTRASVAEIADTLTRIGLEVEEVFDPATALAPFTVAKVVKCEKHPNADKLSCLRGRYRHRAPAGRLRRAERARRPQGRVRAGRKLRAWHRSHAHQGQDQGRRVRTACFCLSASLSFPTSIPASSSFPPTPRSAAAAAKALGLDDAVIEIAITPNRPDCLGVRGVARDLAAAGLGKLKADTVKPVKGSFPNPIPIKLEFDKETASACPVFAGRVIRGVKNGPSPEWLQRRLKAIGLRPINALVDITNYISYDRGRPLHVYDADKLKGAIRARLGRQGRILQGARRQDL